MQIEIEAGDGGSSIQAIVFSLFICLTYAMNSVYLKLEKSIKIWVSLTFLEPFIL